MHDLTVRIESKTYLKNGVPLVLLEGVSFIAKPGRITVLLGESGCGKSTLLRLIVGLDNDFVGTVSLPQNGQDSRLGMVFQDTRLLPWKTVRENIRFAAKKPDCFDDAQVETLLKAVHLEGAGDSYPKDLSGGMAQRAGLARALVEEPDVLLLDEPFSSVDAFTRNALQAELRHLVNSKGLICVFVTHDLDEAIYLADELIIISISRNCTHPVTEVALGHPRDRLSESFARERARIGKILRVIMHREMI